MHSTVRRLTGIWCRKHAIEKIKDSVLKGRDPNIFLWHSSVGIYKHNSQFSVQSDLLFASYARIAASYCCIGHSVRIYNVNISKYKFGDYFAKQMNLQDMFNFHINIMFPKILLVRYKKSHFLGEEWKGWSCRSWNRPLTLYAACHLPDGI